MPTEEQRPATNEQVSARMFLIAGDDDNEGGGTFRGIKGSKRDDLKITMSDNSDYDEETGRETPQFAKKSISDGIRGKK